MSWHLPSATLERYAAGRAGSAEASSAEAHLVACATCRSDVATLVEPDRLARSWHAVADAVDAPGAGAVERALRAIGVREHVARLLAATPSLRLSWLFAVAVVLLFAVFAAWEGAQQGAAFLFVAPLIPLAGVAVAFGPSVDPTYEVSTAAPLANFRLLLIRTTAVVATSLVITAIAAAALPQDGLRSVGWLLPALALASGALALATWVAPWVAALSLGSLWVAGVLLDARAESLGRARFAEALVESTAFRPTGQLLFLAATAASLAVLARRHSTLEFGRNA